MQSHAKSFLSLCMSNLELPVPMIGQLSEIRELCGRFVRATNPTELGYTYDEIKGLDDINVTLLPEKKGSILHKHNEYTVQSKVSPQVHTCTFLHVHIYMYKLQYVYTCMYVQCTCILCWGCGLFLVCVGVVIISICFFCSTLVPLFLGDTMISLGFTRSCWPGSHTASFHPYLPKQCLVRE